MYNMFTKKNISRVEKRKPIKTNGKRKPAKNHFDFRPKTKSAVLIRWRRCVEELFRLLSEHFANRLWSSYQNCGCYCWAKIEMGFSCFFFSIGLLMFFFLFRANALLFWFTKLVGIILNFAILIFFLNTLPLK